MVVTCPNCGSRYAVDPKAIGPDGRKVQCARCNHRWFEILEEEPLPPPAPDVVIRPASVGAALPAVIPHKPKFAWKRLFAISVVILVILAATLFAFRREIAAMISYEARASTPTQVAAAPKPPPAAASAPAAAPMTPPPPATAPIAAPAQPSPPSVVRTTANASAPGPRPNRPMPEAAARPQIEVDLTSSKIDVVDGRYVVRGQLVNNGKAAGSTTQLRLTFKRNDDILGERSFPMVEGPLPPGGRASFSQAIDDPPSGTTNIVPIVE